MLTVGEVFPPSKVIGGPENTSTYNSMSRTIKSGRSDRTKKHAAITKKLTDVFKNEDTEGGLESFEVETYIRSGENSIREIEGYGTKIREAISHLATLGENCICAEEEYNVVKEALTQMSIEDQEKEDDIVINITSDMKKIKKLMKPNVAPPAGDMSGMANLMGGMPKDPDPALNPGTLNYDSSPRELEHWIEGFRAYISNGTLYKPETIVAYISRAMDSDYHAKLVHKKLSKTATLDENLEFLCMDKKIRYPLTLRRL